MGKAPETMRRKKKKGRPSLLELQKRALLQQQNQVNQTRPNLNKNLKNPKPLRHQSPPPPLPNRRSTRRNPNLSVVESTDASEDDDDDDERREKKVKLVGRLPSDDQIPKSSANSSTLNAFLTYNSDFLHGGGNPEAFSKKRKINAAACEEGQKYSKATDSRNGTVAAMESGPTTPLPDRKLLLFILDKLQKKDTRGAFAEPVDPEDLPDYHEVIANPMDFSTVRKKLDGEFYFNLEQFEADILLICSNAMHYNAPHTIYFRQARKIQELAKKEFEDLRQADGNVEPPPRARRGRPPGRSSKKSLENSNIDHVDPAFSSDAALATGGEDVTRSNPYNLRKGPSLYKFRAADGFIRASNGLGNVENHFAVSDSALKGLSMKSGRKQFEEEESRRDTYKQSNQFTLGHDPSISTTFRGGRQQLLAVGLNSDHCYARSLSQFAANLGPPVWKIASKKLRTVLPAGVEFGPGWVGQSEASSLPQSSLSEKLLYSSNSSPKDPYMVKSPYPSTSVCSNATLTRKFSMPREQELVEARGLNCQTEFASLNGIVGGMGLRNCYQIQKNCVTRPGMNGLNGGFGFDFPSQDGRLVPSTVSSSFLHASLPCQMPNTIAGSIVKHHPCEASSSVTPESLNIGGAESSPMDCWSRINVAATESQGRSFWPEVSVQERWDSSSIPVEMNVGFSASASQMMQIGSPPQLDLVLQL